MPFLCNLALLTRHKFVANLVNAVHRETPTHDDLCSNLGEKNEGVNVTGRSSRLEHTQQQSVVVRTTILVAIVPGGVRNR